MEVKVSYTFWKEEDGKYLGYLNQFPDHWTQGDDMNDLKEHLLDLYKTFTSEDIPGMKRVDEFVLVL